MTVPDHCLPFLEGAAELRADLKSALDRAKREIEKAREALKDSGIWQAWLDWPDVNHHLDLADLAIGEAMSIQKSLDQTMKSLHFCIVSSRNVSLPDDDP